MAAAGHTGRFRQATTVVIAAVSMQIALAALAAEPVSGQLELYPRTNYAWPFASGPYYSDVDPPQRRRPGVLHTQVGSFDLRARQPLFPPELRAGVALNRAGRQYFVLLLDPTEMDREGWTTVREDVQSLGGSFVQQVPVAGFIIGLTSGAFDLLRDRPGVAALEPYHPGFKLSPDIGRSPLPDPDAARSQSYDLVVHLFPGESSEAVASFVEGASGRVIAADVGWLRISLHRDHLAGLATLQPVWQVFENPPAIPQAEEASSTVQIGDWLEGPKPYHAAGIDGSGNGLAGATPQVLMVLDSGIQLDAGDLSDTMTSVGTPGPDHRKVVFSGSTNPWGGSGDLEGCEPGTHGHVSAAVALGAASTVPPGYGPPWPDYKSRKVDGVAPGALLASYDAAVGCNPFLGVGNLYSAPSSGSMSHAYGSYDTRVYNFSWGGMANTYSTFAVQVDDFLHDREDALVFASVGNSGPAPQTVLSPATAKNSVAIGATFSGPSPDLDQNDRWPSSSTGPAASQQRVAPLLMAPGADVPSDNAWEIFVCATSDNDQSDPVECEVLEGTAGTSEASPAAAGGALLVRDYFQQGFYPDGTSANPTNPAEQAPNISGALLKALLIASADWVGEGNTPGTNLSVPYRFNNEQGYGRIQLDNVLKLTSWPRSPAGLIVHDGGVAGGVSDLGLLDPIDAVFGETQFQPFSVLDPTQELRVALTWMEDSGDVLINDLDLALLSPDPDGPGPLQPITYFGNYFTDDNDRDGTLDPGEDCPGIDGSVGVLDGSPWSLPACPNSPGDIKHTTEAIYVSPDADADGDGDADFNQLLTGTWYVFVIAAPGGTDENQRFAVAVSGGVTVDGTIYWTGDSFACGETAGFTVLEVDEPDDPASGLTPAEVASRVTLRVLDADTLAVLDQETGLAMTQPEPAVLRFVSAPLTLIPSSNPVTGNGLIEINDGQLLEAVYADETNGAVNLDKQKTATAPTVCSLATPGEAGGLLARAIVPSTGAVRIEYASGCAAADHTIVFGPLDQVASHGYTGQVCDIGTSGLAVFDSGPGSWFFLVVANDDQGVEGSYGKDSSGAERPEDLGDPLCTLVQDLSLSCN